ncbi:hypothetical protein BDY21DRAFT_168386 [Lineolata rhizophorae]|uniref:Uncharacterized protein n=1 Tax=Lineolata rhizophorae TaxID=578093 RepID=A0A6A6P9I9_9PEZI|nr:hypothetical protein BDY21DRAFT_168386 [Lineolata rhizophorae]
MNGGCENQPARLGAPAGLGESKEIFHTRDLDLHDPPHTKIGATFFPRSVLSRTQKKPGGWRGTRGLTVFFLAATVAGMAGAEPALAFGASASISVSNSAPASQAIDCRRSASAARGRPTQISRHLSRVATAVAGTVRLQRDRARQGSAAGPANLPCTHQTASRTWRAAKPARAAGCVRVPCGPRHGCDAARQGIPACKVRDNGRWRPWAGRAPGEPPQTHR